MGLTKRRLAPLYLVTFFRGTYFGILDLTLPLYIISLGISVLNLGILVAAFSAGMLLFEPLWGFLSDRAGRKFFIVASFFFTSLIIPIYLFEEFLSLFILLQFLRGSFRVMAAPSMRALVSDTTSSKDLGTAMGLLWSTMLVGSMVGSFVAGPGMYKDLIVASSLIALFTGVVSLLGLREFRERQRLKAGSGNKNEKNEKKSVKFFLGRNVSVLLVLAVVSVMGLSLIRSFLPIFVIQRLNASAFDVGMMLAIFNGVTALGLPFFGRMSDKIGRKPLILIGLCLFGLMMLSYAFVRDISLTMLLTVGAATGFSLVAPSLLALLTGSVISGFYGTAMGFYGAFEDVGALIGPIIYGIFWSLYGPASILYAYVAIETGGSILALMLREKRMRSSDQDYHTASRA